MAISHVRDPSPIPQSVTAYPGFELKTPPANRPGDKWAHNNLPKTVVVYNEDSTEAISVACLSTTPAAELREQLAEMLKIGAEKILLTTKQGGYTKGFGAYQTVSNTMVAMGVKSFRRSIRSYEHPLVVIGTGLGGIWQMSQFQRSGRQNFVAIERHADFGGTSWITCSNKYTKLQTEKGCYYLDYIKADAPQTNHLKDGQEYKNWPSRDQILQHFREYATTNGLREHTKFNRSVEKVKVLNAGDPKSADPLAGRSYSVMMVPVENGEAVGDGELMVSSAVLSWPGNFAAPNIVEFPGEDNFGGYIEYCSFDKVDYTLAEGKPVMLFGHGAFAIENVRTLLEHKASKVFVVCRKRNLTGMKVASWLCNCTEAPIPGNLLLKIFQKMYDFYDYDCFTCHSVQTDAKRSFAQITSKTVFGVNDLYFLAGHYGLCEIIESDVKRVSHHTVHLMSGRRIQTDMIVKACGTKPDFKFDKIMGVKEVLGFWINGDPLRPVMSNSIGLNARNFAGFSSGPGFAVFTKMFDWFINFPDEFKKVEGMPVRRRDDFPAFVPKVLHSMMTMSVLGNALPALALEMGKADALKVLQMQKMHPMEEFIGAARAEWNMYTDMFRRNGQIDPSTPACPYPYTVTWVNGLIKEVTAHYHKKMGIINDEQHKAIIAKLDREEYAADKKHTAMIQDLSGFDAE